MSSRIRKLGISVLLVEAIWHLGNVSKRLKRILGVSALCLGLVFCGTAAAVELEHHYGPKEVSFQEIRKGPRWVFAHYDYVEEVLPHLLELRCQQKEVNLSFWSTVEILPETIVRSYPTKEMNFKTTPCFTESGELYK